MINWMRKKYQLFIKSDFDVEFLVLLRLREMFQKLPRNQ